MATSQNKSRIVKRNFMVLAPNYTVDECFLKVDPPP